MLIIFLEIFYNCIFLAFCWNQRSSNINILIGFIYLWGPFHICVCSAIPFPCSEWAPIYLPLFVNFHLWRRSHCNIIKQIMNRIQSRNDVCFNFGRHSRHKAWALNPVTLAARSCCNVKWLIRDLTFFIVEIDAWPFQIRAKPFSKHHFKRV